MNKDNIDDEFERIIAGQEDLGDPDLGSTGSFPDSAGDDFADAPGSGFPGISGGSFPDAGGGSFPDAADLSEDVEDPSAEDTLGEPSADGLARRIGLVFAPLSPASGVANMLSMYGIARWIVPIAHQIVLYLELDDLTPSEEDAFDSLLGDDQPMPEEVDRFARIISKLSKHGAVAVVSSLHVEDGSTEGNIVARRYVSGQPEENIAAGLLVNSIDVRAEDLLLGRTKPEDYPDAIHPTDRPHPFKRGFGRPFKH